jgi:pimeloyl-ACP methyl ester carboxylesterase
MNYRIARDDVLIRIDHHLMPIQVDVWAPDNPKMTAICFHQYFGSTQEFSLLGHHLAERGITLVAPLLPGREPSAFLRGGLRYDLATFLRLFIQVCERYQTTKNCLIGHGFGGLLCLAAARARLVRPHALILQEVPLRGNWRASGLAETTAALAGLADLQAEPLERKMLESVQAQGLGTYSPEWAKSLLRPSASGFRTKLDPQLAAAQWPDFDFTDFLERTEKPTGIYCDQSGGLMAQFRPTGIPNNSNCSLAEYASPFSPGFGATYSQIINVLFNNVFDT